MKKMILTGTEGYHKYKFIITRMPNDLSIEVYKCVVADNKEDDYRHLGSFTKNGRMHLIYNRHSYVEMGVVIAWCSEAEKIFEQLSHKFDNTSPYQREYEGDYINGWHYKWELI